MTRPALPVPDHAPLRPCPLLRSRSLGYGVPGEAGSFRLLVREKSSFFYGGNEAHSRRSADTVRSPYFRLSSGGPRWHGGAMRTS
jgi:hypothetical protein